MREAWEKGIVLWGASAGMICWFEAGVTDSFGPQLAGLECLGFLPGSACPHYDGEERSRPRYNELVAGGLPEGIAADDGVALHYVGTELQRDRRRAARAPPRTASPATARSGSRRASSSSLEVVEHAAQLRAFGAERGVHRRELLRAERRQRQMNDASVLFRRRAGDEPGELRTLHELRDRALGQRQRVDEIGDGRRAASGAPAIWSSSRC